MKMIHLPVQDWWQIEKRNKTNAETQGVIGLFTAFVQTTKLLSAKSALDLMHALLGVSHSW